MSQAKKTHTITRRSALLGGAAAMTTAATTIPLAFKAVEIREAWAADSDHRIDARIRAWWETRQTYDDLAAREVPRAPDWGLVRSAMDRAWAAHDEALKSLIKEPAHTPRGVLLKLRVFIEDMDGGQTFVEHVHMPALESIASDLASIAGRAQA